MKVLAALLCLSTVAASLADAQAVSAHRTTEPFLSFLRRTTNNFENGLIDVDRFSEDIEEKFSEIMTGRDPIQIAALEKINEAAAISQIDEAIKASVKRFIADSV